MINFQLTFLPLRIQDNKQHVGLRQHHNCCKNILCAFSQLEKTRIKCLCSKDKTFVIEDATEFRLSICLEEIII